MYFCSMPYVGIKQLIYRWEDEFIKLIDYLAVTDIKKKKERFIK